LRALAQYAPMPEEQPVIRIVLELVIWITH
jgi:hypothetical protein